MGPPVGLDIWVESRNLVIHVSPQKNRGGPNCWPILSVVAVRPSEVNYGTYVTLGRDCQVASGVGKAIKVIYGVVICSVRVESG